MSNPKHHQWQSAHRHNEAHQSRARSLIARFLRVAHSFHRFAGCKLIQRLCSPCVNRSTIGSESHRGKLVHRIPCLVFESSGLGQTIHAAFARRICWYALKRSIRNRRTMTIAFPCFNISGISYFMQSQTPLRFVDDLIPVLLSAIRVTLHTFVPALLNAQSDVRRFRWFCSSGFDVRALRRRFDEDRFLAGFSIMRTVSFRRHWTNQRQPRMPRLLRTQEP